jgi:hypothetical protein
MDLARREDNVLSIAEAFTTTESMSNNEWDATKLGAASN